MLDFENVYKMPFCVTVTLQFVPEYSHWAYAEPEVETSLAFIGYRQIATATG